MYGCLGDSPHWVTDPQAHLNLCLAVVGFSVVSVSMSKRLSVPDKFPDLSMLPSVDVERVDEVARQFEEQSGEVGARDSRAASLKLAISMVDLTTLEGTDTAERVKAMCEKATRPDPLDESIPPVAAVCVYPSLVAVAAKALVDSPVRVASVAAGFPSGQIPISLKLAEIRYAVDEGSDEIDIVISRGKLISGDYHEVFDEICQCKEVCGEAHLKVILETGELESYDNIRIASELAMAAGAHFIKTSTGKTSPAATFPATLVMLHAIRDFHQRTGRMVGMKVAGGIRTSDQALRYLGMLDRVLGADWCSAEWFRFGASSLLDNLIGQGRSDGE